MNQIGKFLSIDFSDSASILTSSGVFAGLLIIFAISCATVWVLVRQAGRMDVPNQRSMHTISTPTGWFWLCWLLLVGEMIKTIYRLALE